MVHRWLTARNLSVLNLDNPRLYQCSNEDHEGRNFRLAGRLLYLILESLRLNRLFRKDQFLSHHCLMEKISNRQPPIFLKFQVEACKWCLIIGKHCMWSVTSSSNTFDPTRILECFLKYQSKTLILDHQENMNFFTPRIIQRINFYVILRRQTEEESFSKISTKWLPSYTRKCSKNIHSFHSNSIIQFLTVFKVCNIDQIHLKIFHLKIAS